MKASDFLIIGGGIIGISLARELKCQFRDCHVVVIEKEPQLGAHASGRNSGVIHAGFYYSADSLKAKFTREGNQALTEYCERKRIKLNRCGKLVVTKDASELPVLDELFRRGEQNSVPLQMITADEAKKIEPRVKTCERTLFSPTTSTADPKEVLEALRKDAIAEGVKIHTGVEYHGRRGRVVETSAGPYEAGYVVNAAGLYADRVARDFYFSENYRVLPFKGIYLYSDEPAGAFRTNIYPVPDLRNPFLGVHFTVGVDGKTKIGPTAIPALWREQYNGFERFRMSEALEICRRMFALMIHSDFGFRRLAIEEVRKRSRKRLVQLASGLAEGVRAHDYNKWGTPGIRAQLLNIRTRKLEMDFVIEGDEHSMHVLNAVSPGWTCAIPFSRYVCEKIARTLHSCS